MADLTLDGNRSIHLAKETFDKVKRVADQVHKKAKVTETMIIDVGGLLIYHTGELKQSSLPNLATLASANHCATNQMAKLVNEHKGFRMSFLEGSINSIYTTGITDDFLLTMVFNQRTTFGMVRINAIKATNQLKRIFMSQKPPTEGETMTFSVQMAHSIKEENFQTELSSRLDDLLGGA